GGVGGWAARGGARGGGRPGEGGGAGDFWVIKKKYSRRGGAGREKRWAGWAFRRRPRRWQGNVGAGAGYAFWRTATEGNRLRPRRHRMRLRHPSNVAARLAERGGVQPAASVTARAPMARKAGTGTLSPMDAYARRRG